MINGLSALNFGGFVISAFTANPLRNTTTTLIDNLVSVGTCHMHRAGDATSAGNYDTYRQPCASGSKPPENYHATTPAQNANAQRLKGNEVDLASRIHSRDSYRQPQASGSKAQEDYYGRNTPQESDDQRRAGQDLEANSRRNQNLAFEHGHRGKLSKGEAERTKNGPAIRKFFDRQATQQASLADFYRIKSGITSQAAQDLRDKTARRESQQTTYTTATFISPIRNSWRDTSDNNDNHNQKKYTSAMHPDG